MKRRTLLKSGAPFISSSHSHEARGPSPTREAGNTSERAGQEENDYDKSIYHHETDIGYGVSECLFLGATANSTA